MSRKLLIYYETVTAGARSKSTGSFMNGLSCTVTIGSVDSKKVFASSTEIGALWCRGGGTACAVLKLTMDSRKTILIIDDNADLRELLTIVIRRLGYEVAVGVTGEEAAERAAAIKPDLIIMDICLPKLNGVEATKQIKAAPATRDIPVVILSALPMFSHGSRAIEAGAVEVLQKPANVSQIEEVLVKHTRPESRRMPGSSTDSINAQRFQETNNLLH